MPRSVTYFYSNVFCHASRRTLDFVYRPCFRNAISVLFRRVQRSSCKPKTWKCVKKKTFFCCCLTCEHCDNLFMKKDASFFSFQSSVLWNFVESELIIIMWKKKRVCNNHFLIIFFLVFLFLSSLQLIWWVYYILCIDKTWWFFYKQS